MRKVLFTLLFIFIFTPVFSVSAQMPIKILLVPGHDDIVWGAQYGNLKEADMNLAVGTELFNILKKDRRLKVYITRDKGGYTTEFVDYFSNQGVNIVSFRENAKAEMQKKIGDGHFIEKESVPHNTATEDVSMILYGINKWANENEMDAVIHIHFNDYPRPNKWTIGKYKGFAIYMPEEQMVNSKESAQLAENIFARLKTKYSTSTYLREKGGLIPDQSLIALGSNASLIPSVRSLLIEYGYIYRFGDNVARHKAYTEMAKLTAQGIRKHFLQQ